MNVSTVAPMGASTAERVIADVGRRIAEQRRARGWTQEVLAEGLGVSLKYVQRIEAGRENLTLRSLVRVAQLLSVEAAALLEAPRSRGVARGRPPGSVAGAVPTPRRPRGRR